MLRTTIALTALLLALLAAACDEAGGLIPGNDDPTPTDAAAASASSEEPVLPPASLRVSAGATEADAVSPVADTELARTVVQIEVIDKGRVPPVVRDGSGVVVDQEMSLVLTSALVVDPYDEDGNPTYDEIYVATADSPGGEPRPTHRAELVAYDAVSGFAVLHVTERIDEDGSATPAPNTGGPDLGLPAATLGDSDLLKQSDPLRLFGYPGLDPSGAVTPQPLQVTAASLTGAGGGPLYDGPAWFKTDARLPHGSGGGPVFDRDGNLVGIATQLAFDPLAPAARVLPITLGEPLLEEARANVADGFEAPLARSRVAPGTSSPLANDRIVVSRPRFALAVIEEDGERNLLDYGVVFPSQTVELAYEFAAQGVPDGVLVQEFWYLNGILQDTVSSSYTWSFGPYALISSELLSPNPLGIPDGTWTLEVWIDGELRAASVAYVGVTSPEPSISNMRFSSTIAVDRGPGDEPAAGDQRLLAFFDFRGAGAAGRLSWVAFHDGQMVYESPELPWIGGDTGSWWIGVPSPLGLDPGEWEIEIHFDGEPAGSGTIEVP